MMLDIQQLNKSYGPKQVLFDINISFHQGSVYGIVGENGAGKSTLFRCIAGFERYEGNIQSDHGNLKNYIGWLATSPIFQTRITGWEYLKLICSARHISEDNFEQQNIFQLPLNEYAAQYSTGMKKKLALMGLLLQKNELYILDEPFNGVDIHSNMMILDIIKELKSNGKTVLIASHIFSTLEQTCDEIFQLKEGRLVKAVSKNDFQELEEEMKSYVIQEDILKNVFGY